MWDQSHGLLRHVVDAQLVAGWVNGTTRFDGDSENDRLCSEFVEVADRTYRLAPAANYEGLLLNWRPRARNLEADWACNAALDAQTHFSWFAEPREAPDLTRYNYTLYSDGGQRDADEGAPDRRTSVCGWAIRRVSRNAASELVALGATTVPGRPTVPNLELMGAVEVQKQWHRLWDPEPPDEYLRETIVHMMLPRFLQAVTGASHW